jgi:predicted ATPase
VPARCPILGNSGGDEPRRLWRDKEPTEEARELLAPVYGQFTEGFETTDLKAAKPLVDYLRRL